MKIIDVFKKNKLNSEPTLSSATSMSFHANFDRRTIG